MIVSTPREALWAWINQRLGIPWSSDFRAIGVVHGGCLAAVVAYNGFTGRMCFMHSAIDNPAVVDRTFLRAIFDYPFRQCGVEYVIGLINSDNEKALKINARCGFKESLRLPGGGMQGKDLVIMTLAASECRWLKEKHESSQVRSHARHARSEPESASVGS